MAERPYKAGYGGTAKAWEDVAVQLRDVKHPESGDLLYGPKTLKAKTLKDRFMLYMEFVQNKIARPCGERELMTNLYRQRL